MNKFTDKEFAKWLGIPYDEELQELWREKKHPCLLWNNKHESIGFYYIYDSNKEYHRCKIAIGIFSEYRHKGYGKIKLEEVIDNLFDVGYTRIQADIEMDNYNSIGLFEKCGFELEGIARNYYGNGETVNVYSVIK